MKRYMIYIALILTAFNIQASSPSVSNVVYLSENTPQFTVVTALKNTKQFKFYLYDNKIDKNAWDASGYTVTYNYSDESNPNKSIPMNAITCSVANNIITLSPTTNDFTSVIHKGYAVLKIAKTGEQVSYARGWHTTLPAPEITSTTAFTGKVNIDWSTFSYTNASSAPSIPDWTTITATTNSNGQLVFSTGSSVVTNETDPAWAAVSNSVVYTNTTAYTNAVALAGSAVQSESDTLQTVYDRGKVISGVADFNARNLIGAIGSPVMLDWSIGVLRNINNTLALDWNSGYLYDAFGTKSVDWNTRNLYGEWTMDSKLDMAGNRIWGVTDIWDNNGHQAVDVINGVLKYAGITTLDWINHVLSQDWTINHGNLGMADGYTVTNLPLPTASTDAANKQYVDDATNGCLQSESDPALTNDTIITIGNASDSIGAVSLVFNAMGGSAALTYDSGADAFSFDNTKIINIADPTSDTGIFDRGYADARYFPLNNGNGASITNINLFEASAVVDSTNKLSLQWWAASNRYAFVQVIGTTTNVTFVSP